jgi:hypothetical protein
MLVSLTFQEKRPFIRQKLANIAKIMIIALALEGET